MSAGSSYAIHGCKLFTKSSNYPTVAKFSSTLDETHVLLIANNCNNYFYNDNKNASILGATVSDTEIRPVYETFIGSKIDGVIDKIAIFNENEINFNKNLNISGDLLPGINNIYDLGSDTVKWKDLYLSGNTAKLGNISLKTDETSLSIMKDENMADLKVKNIKIPVSETSMNKYVNICVNNHNQLLLESIENLDDIDKIVESVNISQMNTNTMVEGSNMFFTWQRA